MVKKNLVVPVLLGSLLAAMVLTGCASMKVSEFGFVWDESLPDEECAIVMLSGGGVSITSYNGVTVDWHVTGFSSFFAKVPAGDASFLLDVNKSARGGVGLKGKDLKFSYNLKPGYVYDIWLNGNTSSNNWGVALYAYPYDSTTKKMTVVSKFEVVPFEK